MIGDRDLGLVNDQNSSASLRNLIWTTAGELGYAAKFLKTPSAMEDDHIPFRRLGVNAVDLIDFDYGPDNRYWHSSEDTIDKLSANSFEIVGEVVLRVLHRLEK